jgi:hypothetical protein
MVLSTAQFALVFTRWDRSWRSMGHLRAASLKSNAFCRFRKDVGIIMSKSAVSPEETAILDTPAFISRLILRKIIRNQTYHIISHEWHAKLLRTMWASTCVQLRIVIRILETTGATGGWFSGSVSLSSQSAPNGQPVGHQIDSPDFQELRCKEFSSAPKAWCFDFSDGALAGRLRVLRCMCCNGLHRLPELWDEKKEKETNPSHLNLSIYPQTHFQSFSSRDTWDEQKR